MNYDFGGIWTPGLCCWFMTEMPQSYSVSPDWNLKLGSLLFVYKGQTTELLSQRWLRGLLEHDKHISVNTPYLITVEHHHTKSTSMSIQILNLSHFRPPDTKKNQFRSLNWNQVNPDIEVKSISTTQTKTESTSMFTLKPSYLGPEYKNRVNFDHYHPHKEQVNR